jgi:hypothetical protein
VTALGPAQGEASYQPSTAGQNFYDADASLVELVGLYAPDDQRPVIEERLRSLGDLVGDRLDDLAHEADRHQPASFAGDDVLARVLPGLLSNDLGYGVLTGSGRGL